MGVGDKVVLSDKGREARHLFPDPNVEGTVARPGTSRGGMYVRVLVGGEKEPRTFAKSYWTEATE